MLLAAEREQSERVLAHERAETGLEAELSVIADRLVARGLQKLAARSGADLIVVGRGHHGLLGRALDSDDAAESLGGAPCSVAIAPAGYASRPASLVRFGAGYDGSPGSERAITLMREIAARRPGSTMRALAAGRRPLIARDGIELETVRTDAAPALERFSEELDLLIVGSRTSSALARLFVNRTASHLARYSRCPLIVTGC